MIRLLYLSLLGFVLFFGGVVFDVSRNAPTLMQAGGVLMLGSFALLCVLGIIKNGDL